MSVIQEFTGANERYAATFQKGNLPLPPARKVAVLACMDARLDPARVLGLEEGDAHVIRNAGGRAADAACQTTRTIFGDVASVFVACQVLV